MNREDVFQAMTEIDDRYISEALRYSPGNASSASERIIHMKKRIITLALAAALMLALGISAYAEVSKVSNPKTAEKIALEELETWKKIGLISEELSVNRQATKVVEIEEYTGSDYWFGRLFTRSYDVRFYGGADNKYFLNLSVDTITGKIKAANIEAAADKKDVPVNEIVVEEPDPTNPSGERIPVTYYFYDNFDDIFPADLTVDDCCKRLAEYWGFSGYKLADTVDDWYNSEWDAVEGDTLLQDLPMDNYYLTIYFDGDQEGAPMYLQLEQFPGRVCFSLGTRHLVG